MFSTRCLWQINFVNDNWYFNLDMVLPRIANPLICFRFRKLKQSSAFKFRRILKSLFRKTTHLLNDTKNFLTIFNPKILSLLNFNYQIRFSTWKHNFLNSINLLLKKKLKPNAPNLCSASHNVNFSGVPKVRSW